MEGWKGGRVEGWKDGRNGRLEGWKIGQYGTAGSPSRPPRRLSSGNAAARGTATLQVQNGLQRFDGNLEGFILPSFHPSNPPSLHFFQRAVAQKPVFHHAFNSTSCSLRLCGEISSASRLTFIFKLARPLFCDRFSCY